MPLQSRFFSSITRHERTRTQIGKYKLLIGIDLFFMGRDLLRQCKMAIVFRLTMAKNRCAIKWDEAWKYALHLNSHGISSSNNMISSGWFDIKLHQKWMHGGPPLVGTNFLFFSFLEISAINEHTFQNFHGFQIKMMIFPMNSLIPNDLYII